MDRLVPLKNGVRVEAGRASLSLKPDEAVSIVPSGTKVAGGRPTAKTIAVTDFGAVPNDGESDCEALKKATAESKKHERTRIVFVPGVYDFSELKAIADMDWWMSRCKMGSPYAAYMRPLI